MDSESGKNPSGKNNLQTITDETSKNSLEIQVSLCPLLDITFRQERKKGQIFKNITIINRGQEIRDVKLHLKSDPYFIELTKPMSFDTIHKNEVIKITDFDKIINIDFDYLVQITESTNCKVNIVGYDSEYEPVGTSKTSIIRLLPYSEWPGLGEHPERLSAFIIPEDPTLVQIRSEIQDVLKRWGCPDKFTGYKDKNVNDVRDYLAAIYEVLRLKGIVYIDSRTDYKNSVQKLRLFGEVLLSREGTCLDLTILIASILESAGLNPLIFFSTNHFFVGVWLKDRCFDNPLTYDNNIVFNEIQSDSIIAIETSDLTKGNNTKFNNSEDNAKFKIEKEILFTIDVKRSREIVSPLPIRKKTDGKLAIDEDEEAEYWALAPNPLPDHVGDYSPTIFGKRDLWERKLLNISLRNSLINLKITQNKLPLMINDAQAFINTVRNGKEITIIDKPNSWTCGNFESNPYELSNLIDELDCTIRNDLERNIVRSPYTDAESKKRLSKIYTTSRTDEEETGSNTLNIAINYLKWNDGENVMYAPILLIPVEIKRKGTKAFSIKLRDEPITINETLLEKIRRDDRIEIGGLSDIVNEETIDIRKITSTISQKIAGRGWSIVPSAILGCFSFNEFVMWKDLKERGDLILDNKIVKSLVDNKISWDARPLRETSDLKDVHLTDNADSSQIIAIKAAMHGNTFLLHGPPGTGKSQTITNIISNLLYEGKTVLFVAEKSAALEVVQNRLNRMGIGQFCLELHSKKTDRMTVLKKLDANLSMEKRLPKYRILEYRLNSSTDELDSYRHSLYFNTLLGEPLRDVISLYCSIDETSVKIDQKSIDRKLLNPNFTYDFDQYVARLSGALSGIDFDTHPYKNVRLYEYNDSLTDCVQEILNILVSDTEKIYGMVINSGLESNLDINELITLIENLSRFMPDSYNFDKISAMDQDLDYIIANMVPSLESIDYIIRSSDLEILLSRKKFNDDCVRLNSVLEAMDSLPIDGIGCSTFKNCLNLVNKIHSLLIVTEDAERILGAWTAQDVGCDDKKIIGLIDAIKRSIFFSENYNTILDIVERARVSFSEVKKAHTLISEISLPFDLWDLKGLELLDDQLEHIDLNHMPPFDIESYRKKIESVNSILKDLLSRVNRSRDVPFFEERISFNKTLELLKMSVELRSYLDEYNASHLEELAYAYDILLEIIERINKDINSVEGRWNLSILNNANIALVNGWSIANGASFFKKKKLRSEYLSSIAPFLMDKSVKFEELDCDIRLIEKIIMDLEAVRSSVDRYCNADKINQEITYFNALLKKIDSEMEFFNRYIKDGVLPPWAISAKSKQSAIKHYIEVTAKHQEILNELLKGYDMSITNKHVDLLSLTDSFSRLGTICQINQDIRPVKAELNKFLSLDDLTKEILNITDETSSLIKTVKYVLKNHKSVELLYKNVKIKDISDILKRIVCEHEKLSLTLKIERNPPMLLEGYLSHIRDLDRNLPRLREWIICNEELNYAKDHGYAAIIDHIKKGIPLDEIQNSFKKATYRLAITRVLDKQKILSKFKMESFEGLIAKFKNEDESLMEYNRDRLLEILSRGIPSDQESREIRSEISYLSSRAAKTRVRNSLRSIFQNIPTILPRLAPCMLMSPISVAQYLDPNMDPFDYIIFDEASQIPTHMAVGALARGKEAIIVGDAKQLPPTEFFTVNNNEEEYEDEDLDEMESILDECQKLRIPGTRLLWHYRSRHESLIAFSNKEFYGNELQTFPSPNDMVNKVIFKKVTGTYGLGTTRSNKGEAKKVVEEIINRLKDPVLSKQSMGVVTFGAPQRDEITSQLEEYFTKDQSLYERAYNRAEPLFIKNLETVQGDERDVIIFSIGYGRNEEGKMLGRFGPLSADGGWRRLNVAITRSKNEMVIFSTITSDDIEIRKETKMGVLSLKKFLDYAERGMASSERNVSESRQLFNNILASELRKAGYDAVTDLGRSGYRVDVAVINPENESEYILGIMTDGESYHSSKNTRDREFAQQDVLERLGWNVVRVWSIEWYYDKEHTINRLINKIDELRQNYLDNLDEILPPEEKITEDIEIEHEGVEIENIIEADNREGEPLTEETFEDAPSMRPVESKITDEPDEINKQFFGIPYVVARPYTQTIHENKFNNVNFSKEFIETIEEIIETESPICVSSLKQGVFIAYGLDSNRRNNKRFEELLSMVPTIITKSIGGHDIIWSNDISPKKYRKYRNTSGIVASRNLEMLTPEEIANAIGASVKPGITKKHLFKSAIIKLGYDAIPAYYELALEKSFKYAIEEGLFDVNLVIDAKYLEKTVSTKKDSSAFDNKVSVSPPVVSMLSIEEPDAEMKMEYPKYYYGLKYNTYNAEIYKIANNLAFKIIENESPITDKYLIKKILRMLGKSETSDKRIELSEMLMNSQKHAIIIDENEVVFCSKKINYEKYKKYRYGIRKELSDIPSIEIVNATLSLVKRNAMKIGQLAHDLEILFDIIPIDENELILKIKSAIGKKSLVMANGYVMKK